MIARALPHLEADLFLLHAPAFFDFRDRGDLYLPYLGTSGDVPITPLYELFPVGFKTLVQHLGAHGHEVRIVNLSSLLLLFPELAIDDVLGAMRAKVFGIDLHWMVHVQGALEIARRLKAIHPDVPVIFGGISSSYFADELVRYPFIDLVMRGWDTHASMTRLLEALDRHEGLDVVPGLVWKKDGAVVNNAMTTDEGAYVHGIDWTHLPSFETAPGTLPIREVLSTHAIGCTHACGWCGGSRDAFRRVFDAKRTLAHKPEPELELEMRTMAEIPNLERFHFYSVGSYNETPEGMARFLAHVEKTPLRSVSYEEYHLPSDAVMKRMVAANRRTIITLSPESSDLRVAKLAGRGVYTMEEMERWIERALDLGVHQVDLWFFVGMPEQDASSVARDVDYAEHLLRKFRGRRVVPYVCPMIPFLDPASTFFESPEEHGYRVFFRTVEEHRRGMTRPSILDRINYETRWLSRRDLVHVGYGAVRRLVAAKAENGLLPTGIATSVIEKIDDALDFIDVVHEADVIADANARARALDALAPAIRRRNDDVLFGGVTNQAVPIGRDVGGRWFDELGWPLATLEAARSGATPGGA